MPADRGKQKAQAVLPAPGEKKAGHALSRAPAVEFLRSEREADSQAELPLIKLGAIDFHKAPAGKVPIGIVEMW